MTYLGHVSVATGFWYLHSTPLLMKRIADACAANVLGIDSSRPSTERRTRRRPPLPRRGLQNVEPQLHVVGSKANPLGQWMTLHGDGVEGG